MRRLVGGLLLIAFMTAVAPVMTITRGVPDGDRHPYVGIAIQPIPSMPGFVTVCSGSALSETTFLTSAHCFDPNESVLVSYDASPPLGVVTGTFHPHPDWCVGCGPGLQGADSHDVAVIVLDVPLDPGGFAELPAIGLVDTLPQTTDVDLVGYGVQGFVRGSGPPGQIFLATRYFAPSQLVQSNNRSSAEFIKLTANPGPGKGGVCSGDSGGPNLLADTNIVLAVNSFVSNDNCAGVAYSNRVDLQDIQDFINSFFDPN
jgi:hypothetical protein